MTTKNSRPAPQAGLARFVARVAAFLTGALAACAAVTASAQGIATFTLVDNTNLPAGKYQIYVTGFSTAGPYVLQPDGSWATPVQASGTLPCYRFPQDIQQIQINGTQTSISARVYYFVVTDTSTFTQCNPSPGSQGLFGLNPNGFTYSAFGAAVTVPTVSNVTSKSFPAWTFSEIGTSATTGTIDLSQVDFFAFPMNMTASVTTATPANPSVAGNPVGSTANPGDVVNHASVRDAYGAYADALAVAQGAACSGPTPPAACEYKKLLRDITTGGSTVPLYVIENPGGYVVENPASPLNQAFDGVINALWNAGAAPLSINTGGAFGGIAQDTFVSSYVTMLYPSNPISSFNIAALKFTGQTTGTIAYVFSPIGLQVGCQTAQIPAVYCPSNPSSGFQVFGAAGALAQPVNNDNFNTLNGLGLLKSGTAAADYSQLVGRLGLLLSSAMNRGVALVNCPSPKVTWQCWQDETYWYPTTVSATFPDITQNLFSYWMHTAAIQGTPMFVQPPGAVNGASGTPGGGKPMGMAYGFAADENPTPQAVSPNQPEVPSKFDQTVKLPGSGTLTFGPWVTTSVNPTLSVVVSPSGGGTVSSSPSGIDCGPDCSSAYAAGTSVQLTATPATGYVFSGWSGACTGTSTTCTVVVSATTTATATFTPTAPSTFGLTVVVSGPGTVGSAPSGISCGASCSASFAANSTVTLTATPAPGATFVSWSGACSGSSPTCAVTMSAARNVGATFAGSAQVALNVTTTTGGIVTSLPGGINCGTTCAAGFAVGASVSLVATPSIGYSFTGWGGACTGTNVCDLVMNASKSVSATFAPVPVGQYALTVQDIGNGTIVSAPAGINCGTVCANSFPTGTQVTLTATPDPGSTFAGWGGACTGLGTCVVLMDQLQTVTATFLTNAPPGAVQVPTLSQWALMLLAGLVALAGACSTRGRRL